MSGRGPLLCSARRWTSRTRVNPAQTGCRHERVTHDYKRNGTTTLFAALNILDGTVVGRCMPKYTHKEFIKFLNAVERAVLSATETMCY